MMRFPGNTVAKRIRMGRRNDRAFSSMGEKDVPMGDMELFVNNVAGLVFKGASGVVGFVLGGLAAPVSAEDIKNDQEIIIQLKQTNDEREVNMEKLRKR